MARVNLFPHAAHGTHRDDPLHTEGFEAVDVGAKIDRRRWQTMPSTMARQKHHLAHILQSRHGVEAATPDDANFALSHACSPSLVSLPPLPLGEGRGEGLFV